MNSHSTIDQIRQEVAARDTSLQEARTRRDWVRKAAASYAGSLRTYQAGSLATRFTNHPVSDADAGVVMDRRTLPNLGPDGKGELPAELVNRIRLHIRPQLAAQYPKVRVERMKRGLLVRFNRPLTTGEDPTVDLVVALNRAVDDALWIPNLDRNRWDPSHPEKHVELFTAGVEGLRRTRRHVVRAGQGASSAVRQVPHLLVQHRSPRVGVHPVRRAHRSGSLEVLRLRLHRTGEAPHEGSGRSEQPHSCRRPEAGRRSTCANRTRAQTRYRGGRRRGQGSGGAWCPRRLLEVRVTARGKQSAGCGGGRSCRLGTRSHIGRRARR